MEYIGGILKGSTADVKPEEAISILSDRLQHASLSTDRRTAISGLKSFSRQYREIVVEYGSKALLRTLNVDSEVASTMKAVLETMLILMMNAPDKGLSSTSSSGFEARALDGKFTSPLLSESLEMDQFSLWIADECTSNTECLSCLLSMLQSYRDYHVRLYTVQLLEALLIARAVRTRDLLSSIPSSISTIVAVLDDDHDRIRSEGILLLTALVKGDHNTQKVVAFENSFEKLLRVIKDEGGLRGSVVVEDCLSLLYDLLSFNASNQKYFLETGCTPALVDLLDEPFNTISSSEDSTSLMSAAIVWNPQRLKNMAALLHICSTFVDVDNQDAKKNQDALFNFGVFYCVSKIAFAPGIDSKLRTLALQVTGNLMAGNSRVQSEFARIDLPYIDLTLPIIGKNSRNLPAPHALTEWSLSLNSVHCFQIRLSSAYCFQCFVRGNKEIKTEFMKEFVDGFQKSQSATVPGTALGSESHQRLDRTSLTERAASQGSANLISVLVQDYDQMMINPYRPWFAAFFMTCLIEDCEEAKRLAEGVMVGEKEKGEDVMSYLQAISQMLVTTLEFSDPRIPLAYISLLTYWLFEDYDAVDEFLQDIDTLKGIMANLMKSAHGTNDLTEGAGYILLGTVYEFSRGESPCPRQTLHDIIVKSIGAENYSLKVKKFFQRYLGSFTNDVNALDYSIDETGLPSVFINPIYQHLIQDNFQRIKETLLHDSGKDRPPKITYELFEALNAEHQELKLDFAALQQKYERCEVKSSRQIEELSSAVEAQNETIAKISEEKASISSENTNLKKSASMMSVELGELKDSLSILKMQNSELAEQLRMTEDNNKKIVQRNKALVESLDEATRGRIAAENGINKMNKELRQLIEKNDKLKRENGILQDRAKHSGEAHTSEISRLKKTISRLAAQYQSISSDVGAGFTQFQNETQTFQDHSRDTLREREERDESMKVLIEKLKAAAQIVLGLKESLKARDEQIANLKLDLVCSSNPKAHDEVLQETARENEDQNAALTSYQSLKNSTNDQRSICQENNGDEYSRLGQETVIREHSTAKQKSETSNSGDFEELMLLWEDQNRKLRRYKEVLKDLNFEVSSDEEPF